MVIYMYSYGEIESPLACLMSYRPIARISQGGGSYFGKCGPFTFTGTDVIAFAILVAKVLPKFYKLRALRGKIK